MRSGKLPQLPELLREQEIENAYRSEARVNDDDIHLIEITSPIWLCHLAYKALEGDFTNEEVGLFLIPSDLAKSNGTRAKTVGPFQCANCLCELS